MRTFVRALVVIGSVAAGAVTQGAARADSPTPATASPWGPSASPASPSPASPGATQPPAAAPATKAASEKNGIVQIVDEAMAGVHLRPEQTSAIQKMGGEADQKVAAVDQAKREFLLGLATQIEEDKVDANNLKPQISKFFEAADATSPVLRGDLEKIHGILDAEQRKEFSKGLRDALKKREGMAEPKKHLEEWAKTLKLSDDQKKQIGEILSEEAPMNKTARDRIDTVIDAFPQDKFSIDELEPHASVKDRVRDMAEHIVAVAKKVTAVLTPEQRKEAAEHLRERASGQMAGTPSSGRTGGMGGATSETESAESISGGEEEVGTTSEGLWTGAVGVGGYRGAATAASYRSYSGYGFGGGYSTGFGGTYLI
jgi:Spy/CpxP family protein refolding chaperone